MRTNLVNIYNYHTQGYFKGKILNFQKITSFSFHAYLFPVKWKNLRCHQSFLY